MTTYYKGKIGKQDIEFGTGTFVRRDKDLAWRELNQINDSDIPLKEDATKVLSDLFDAGYDVDIYPRNIIPKSSADTVMTEHTTFTASDGHIFWRDPGGADRNFNPSGTFVRGHEVTLINTADASETITFDSTTLSQDIDRYERAIFRYNGTIWTLINLYTPQGENLELDNSLSSDHTFSGLYSIETAGENLVFGNAVYYKSDGEVWLSDADAVATMPIIGLAVASISADATGNILRQGYARDNSWTWTVGGLIYASSTGGALTQTAPSGGFVQVVGYAFSADIMYFDPDYTMLADEDDMASDSAAIGVTQQSGKAYTDEHSIIQIVNSQSGALVNGATVSPDDDTIPQKTEGNELLTLAITPTNASNNLKIDISIAISQESAGEVITVALFQDDTAGAISAMQDHESTSNEIMPLQLTHFMTAGTTSATTFKVRGGASSGDINMNGINTGRLMGGVMASSITITEIEV